jgi:hypothetical protein
VLCILLTRKENKLYFLSHFISLYVRAAATAYFPSKTAQSGEESTLVASLRGVIAKQAAEIEALQSKLKELTTAAAAAPSLGSATAPTTTSEDSQAAAKVAEVSRVFFSFLLWLADGD